MNKELTAQESVVLLINIAYKAQENGILTIKESALLDRALRTLIPNYDDEVEQHQEEVVEEKKAKIIKKEVEF